MKMKIAVTTGLLVAFMLLPSAGSAQSREEGEHLFEQAKALQENASSKEDLETAVRRYEAALSIFEQEGYGPGIGMTVGNLAVLYQDLGQYSKAAKLHEKSLRIDKLVGDEAGEARALTNLGNVYHNWGDYAKSIQYYEQSLAITRKLGDEQLEGQTLGNLGVVYKNLGQYSKALECCDKSLKIAKKMEDARQEGNALNNFGAVYSDWSEYAKAAECYEKALEIKRKIGDAKGEGQTLGNLGLVHQAWGQYKKAIEYYEKSSALAMKMGDVKAEANAFNNLGNVYQNWGQYKKAVEYYEKSLALGENTADLKLKAIALGNLGNAYQLWHQYDKAIEYFEASLGIMKKIGDVRGESAILGNLGCVYQDLGQNDKAIALCKKSLTLAEKIGDPHSKAYALGKLGTAYQLSSQYSKAVEYYEESLAIIRKIGDIKGEGAILGNLGTVYHSWGEYAKAVEYHEKSLEISRKIGYIKGEGETLGNLGNVYARWGQYGKAVEYYEKDLEICKKIGDMRGVGAVYGNIGVVYKDLGMYAKAAECYQQGLDVYRRIGDARGVSSLLGDLGNVYLNWGQYAKALVCYQKDLEICRKICDVEGEGKTLNGLGVFYEGWGQHGKALQYYEESLAIMRKIGNARSQAIILGNIGCIYSNQKEYPKAQEKFRQGLEIYEKIKLPSDWFHKLIGDSYLDSKDIKQAEPHLRQANYSASLGRLHLLKFDYETTRQHYEKLLASAEKNKDAERLFTAYTGLGMAYEGINDNAKAVEYFRRAIEQTEELRSSLNRAQRETFFDVKIDGFYRTAPYEGLARVLLKMNQPADAFKESEYTKARSFAERLSKRGEADVSGVPHEILERDSALNEEMAAVTKGLQLGYEKDNKYIIAALEPQVREARRKLATHIDMLRKEYPLFAATKYPQHMGLEQTALKPGEWVLSYDVTDSGIIIYLTKGKDIAKAVFRPIPRDDLDSLVRAFRKPLEIAPGRDNLDEKLKSFDLLAGKKLCDLLLSDILDSLPSGVPLIIVPDDSLGVLPFEMLVLNDKGSVKTDKGLPQVSGAEFFGDRNPISYNQSISALTLARTLSNQQSRGEKLLALVDPVCDPHDPRRKNFPKQKKEHQASPASAPQNGLVFERLPLTSKLGESLKAVYPSQIELYTGMDAQKSVLLNKDLSPYGSIVFGTHGYFGEDLSGIREPVLVLTLLDQPKGQSGFLTRTEVMGLKNLNCEVAALVACQTGLGRRITGEGTMGMGRAFQYAGAKSVLMSLWSVSDIASVNLVSVFFNSIKQGKARLEALRIARDIIRKNGYDHPFYWASFILVGEVN